MMDWLGVRLKATRKRCVLACRSNVCQPWVALSTQLCLITQYTHNCAFSVLTLLVGRQEKQQACKN